jgi:hypothetical protein
MDEVQRSSEDHDIETQAKAIEDKKNRRSFCKPSWWFEHLLLPLFVAVVCIILNNYWQSKRQPNLVAYAEQHWSTEITEGNFRIICPFTIMNTGGSVTNKRKLTFSLHPNVNIDSIDISDEYSSFWNLCDGGLGCRYAVISVDLPRNMKI